MASTAVLDFVSIIPINDQVLELQTILMDQSTSRCDFVFYADRLSRLVVEEGLNRLPTTPCVVTTPTGAKYTGVRFNKGNCGVSICRSGEAMEKALRECCQSIKIGKVLIDSDPQTNAARLLYAKLPPDIAQRQVLLLYPIIGTGNTVSKAVSELKSCQVEESKILLLTLFCTHASVNMISQRFPLLTMLTSQIDEIVPRHFGMKYFGTE